MKIKKGDTIIVIAGKDRGKTGTVLFAYPKKEHVLVDGVGIVKKHARSGRSGKAGQIIERPSPIHVSNVSLKDPKDGVPTRVGYKREGEKNVRVAKKSGTVL